MLSPMPARKLTDREISKILGGAIGGAAKAGVSLERAKRALEVFAVFLQGGGELGGDDVPWAEGGGPDAPWVGVLGGVVGGLCGFCRPSDVSNAIVWLVGHWDEMVEILTQ